MNISFTFKNIEPSEHLRKYAEKKVQKLSRYFGKKQDGLEAQVVLSVDKFRHRVEFQLLGAGHVVSADEQSDDMYAAIDLVTDKIDAQVKKFISKEREKRRQAKHGAAIDIFSYHVVEEEGEKTIVGLEQFTPKPMSPDEAVLQLDKQSYEFLVFLNAENERINVIYKRRNGDYGLIDPM